MVITYCWVLIIWTCASEEEAIINDTDYCFSSAPEVL